MRVRLATTEDVLARAGHCALAEPVLHPLAHALFAALVEVPVEQITDLANGDKVWRLPPEPWKGEPLELIGRLRFMDFERDPTIRALTTVEALRALLEHTKRRDRSGFDTRKKSAGVSDLETLFLRAVPVLPSLARGPQGPFAKLDLHYNSIVYRKDEFQRIESTMPFSVYRLTSANCAKSVFDLFDLVPLAPKNPHQRADVRRSLRMYLQESVGGRLPLSFSCTHLDIDVPDTEPHRTLLEGLALVIES
jgi:hypothetical protein